MMLLTLLLACGNGLSGDLDRLCDTAKAVDADASVPADGKLAEIERRYPPPGRAMKTILDAVGYGDKKVQYELIVGAAKDQGVPDWTCPPLETALEESPGGWK